MSARQRSRRPLKRESDVSLSPPHGVPWIWLTRDMLDSLAYRALSRAGLQMLACLMVEHCNHAGKENGRLAVSWDAFEAVGIHRGMIQQTLEEVTRLGFVEIVDRGHRGYGAALGRRAIFRLTFAGVVNSERWGRPTNEWASIISEDDSRLRGRKVRTSARHVERCAMSTPTGEM